MLRAIFKTRTRAEWLAELAEIDACVGPVYTLEEAMDDPHARARGASVSSSQVGADDEIFRTLPSFPRISGVEAEQRYAPPSLGQHTGELLLELGYSEEEIEQLKDEGVI